MLGFGLTVIGALRQISAELTRLVPASQLEPSGPQIVVDAGRHGERRGRYASVHMRVSQY